MAHDGLKMALRWPKAAPRWPQMAQDGSKTALKWFQDRIKWSQVGSKTAQVGLKLSVVPYITNLEFSYEKQWFLRLWSAKKVPKSDQEAPRTVRKDPRSAPVALRSAQVSTWPGPPGPPRSGTRTVTGAPRSESAGPEGAQVAQESANRRKLGGTRIQAELRNVVSGN